MSIWARYLWDYLPCYADRDGLLEDRPLTLKGGVFPADAVDCKALLDEMEARGLIVRYRAGTRRAIWIPHFLRYQRPVRHEASSKLDPPPADVVARFHAEHPDADAQASDDPDDACADNAGALPGQCRGIITTEGGCADNARLGSGIRDPGSDPPSARARAIPAVGSTEPGTGGCLCAADREAQDAISHLEAETCRPPADSPPKAPAVAPVASSPLDEPPTRSNLAQRIVAHWKRRWEARDGALPYFAGTSDRSEVESALKDLPADFPEAEIFRALDRYLDDTSRRKHELAAFWKFSMLNRYATDAQKPAPRAMRDQRGGGIAYKKLEPRRRINLLEVQKQMAEAEQHAAS